MSENLSGMVTVEPVDDPDDPRVADFVALNDPASRRRREHDGGFFVAEGVLVIEQLLRSRYPVRSFLVSERGLRALDRQLSSEPAGTGAPVYLAGQAVIEKICGFDFHRGALASAGRLPLPDVATATAGADLVVVVEGVNDHENLGALFRNAAALGVDAVMLGPGCADPLYRRSVRVSMGHVLRVPFASLRSWPDDLEALRVAGFRIAALTPAVKAVPLTQAGVATGRVAWLLGAEGSGLSSVALGAADLAVRIPMAPGVDSLNVATAAAIAFAGARRI